MSAIFESLKKLDQKDKVLGVIEPDPSHAEKAERSLAGQWVAFAFVFFGLALLTLAYLSHIKFQELGATVSSQHASFIGRFDQLTTDIAGLDQRIVSLESGHKAVLSRQSRIAEDQAKEQETRREALEKLSQEIGSLQIQLDDRMTLLSQRIGALEAPVNQTGQDDR